MDHHELLKEIQEIFDKRFDRVEEKVDQTNQKLDKFSEVAIKNKADIEWVRGYIKTTLTILITLITAAVTVVASFFTGK